MFSNFLYFLLFYDLNNKVLCYLHDIANLLQKPQGLDPKRLACASPGPTEGSFGSLSMPFSQVSPLEQSAALSGIKGDLSQL